MKRKLVIIPKERIDLGLAICSALTPPGVRRTLDEIAAFCGCKRGTIWVIQDRALRKLRKRLLLRKDPELTAMLGQVIDRPPGERFEIGRPGY